MRTTAVTLAIAAALAAVLVAGSGEQTGPNAFVILGLVNGAVFGLLALGLVLVYKGTRVFNFAQAEYGTLAAFFLFFGLQGVTFPLVGWKVPKLPYWGAVLIALLLVLLIGLLVERVVIRPLLSAPRITVLVATIATALMAIGLELFFFKAEPKSLQAIPVGDAQGFEIFNLPIGPQQLIVVGVLAALGLLLAYFFSRTNLGLAVLATSQDAFATRVVGIGVERMSRFIWGSAALLGGIAGILYVPIIGLLVPGGMTSAVLIPAFSAAVLGGMTSLPGAFVGGVVVGVIQNLALWAAGTYSVGDKTISATLPGSEQISVLLVMLIILLSRPQGLLGRET